jgi:hypothetical protein
MGTVAKLNDVLCANISKVDDILKANASKWDDNTFCPSATPTPTPTPSPAVNCRSGTVAELASYSFWDCCGVYFEGSGEPGFIACFDANRLNSGISNDGSCTVSCVTPTPTPTPTNTPTNTPTPTPTPSACVPDCCDVELCVGSDCSEACSCIQSGTFYLSMPCGCPGNLQNATGIFEDDRCGTPAREGYYSDGTYCYYWDGSSSLSYQSNC